MQRRNLTTEGRGTQSSWDKLNKKLEPLAQIHSTSGDIHWHASIREEWKELHILGSDEEHEEQEPSLDDPEDVGEDNREEEDPNYNTEEEEEVPNHRRDENNVPLRTLLTTLDHSSGACVNSGEWPKIHVKRW